MAKKQDTISIGFEEKIWKAADILRGNLSASQYEGVVLGLIFLKYISDRFEQKFQELQGDEYADPEDKDEYTADNIFFVPAEARWSKISAAAHTPEIGVVIDEALTAIERENERLKGILPKNFARPELDKRRLGDVVDLFTNIEMHDAGEEKDLLGRTYEYCLQQFASLEGKNGGEFYTPSCIVRTLVEILEPYEGRVYDPCCGSGGMFVQSAKFIERHKGNLRKISIYGQEANPDTWKMAHMNLAIRGLDANLGKIFADTFYDDQHPTLKADYILANPPFNLSDWGQSALQEDVRWQYGLPPAGNANFAWMQHMIHHLAPNGKIGLVLANGALSSQSGGEGQIRQAIIEADLVEGIVALPSQLFYSTGIPVSLWFISRNKAQKGKTVFIDARNLGSMVTRKLRCGVWRQDSRFAQRMTAAVLVFACVFTMVHIGIGKFGQWHTDSDLVEQDTNALLLKNDLPEGDYRIDTYKIHDNIGMWLDKSCLQYFGSTAAPSILSFYPGLGVKRDVRSEPEITNYALRGLLSVEYLITTPEKRESFEDEADEGWTYLADVDGYTLYHNDNYVPMGFTYDYYVTEATYETSIKTLRSNLLMRALVLTDEDVAQYGKYLTELPDAMLDDLHYDSYTQDCADRRAHSCSVFQMNNAGFHAEITLDKTNLVFFSVPYDDGFTAYVNGEKADILRVDEGLMAVLCPAGASSIDFVDQAAGLSASRVVTAVAIPVWVVYVAYFVRRKRRSTGTPAEE